MSSHYATAPAYFQVARSPRNTTHVGVCAGQCRAEGAGIDVGPVGDLTPKRLPAAVSRGCSASRISRHGPHRPSPADRTCPEPGRDVAKAGEIGRAHV